MRRGLLLNISKQVGRVKRAELKQTLVLNTLVAKVFERVLVFGKEIPMNEFGRPVKVLPEKGARVRNDGLARVLNELRDTDFIR